MNFSEIPLFEGLTEAECLHIVECFGLKERRFADGATIADYSGSNRTVGIVLYGAAEMIRIDEDGNRTVLEFLERNDLYGDALAFPAPYDSVSVVGIGETGVLTIDFEDVSKRCDHACAAHSKLVKNMFRLIALKSRALSSRLEVLSGRSIRDKLMNFFRQSADKAGSNRFELPFSMTTLADYISSDRSATARELKKMRDERIVTVERKCVTLLDRSV